jgi:hypothetical protein
MRTLSPLRIALLVAAAASLGCDDDRPLATELPTGPAAVPANALSAFVTVSDSRPGVGDQLTVAVRALRGQSVGAIGSYTLRLAYDSTKLRLLDTGRSDFGMVMANGADAGVIVAAGASSQGFTDDQLLVARFMVTGARAVASLKLDVTELNSLKFENQMSAMKIEQQVYRMPAR